MDHVSKPLLGLLVATLAFFAVWLAALRPTSETGSGGSPQGVGQFNSAIKAAHAAAATSAASGGKVAGPSPAGTSPAAGPKPAATPAPAAVVNTPSHPARSAAASRVAHGSSAVRPGRSRTHHQLVRGHQPAVTALLSPAARLRAVRQALAHHRVIALLFLNPTSADDQAVLSELAAVPTDGGRVLKLAVPLSELSRYSALTAQVPVSGSPTLVIIDRARRAQVVVGFADRFEIAQRVYAALAG